MKRKYRGKYLWHDWFALRHFTLRWAEDYNCSQSAIVQQIRNEASKRGLHIKVTEEIDGIEVEVLFKTQPLERERCST